MNPLHAALTIRTAAAADTAALTRLATLDSAQPLSAPVLVAEIDGQLRAAISLWDGSEIADPFHPTAGVLSLMRAHVERSRREVAGGRRRARRLSARGRVAASPSWRPA